jgi:hypothetical protein
VDHDYTYFGIYDGINEWNADQGLKRATGVLAEDVIRIHGTLLPQKQKVHIHYLSRQASGTLSTQTPGDYALRLLGSQGQTLAEHAFTPIPDDESPNSLSFGLTVPFAPAPPRHQIVRLADQTVGRTGRQR